MPNVTKVSSQELRDAVHQLAAVDDSELAMLLGRSEARSFGDGENLFFEGQAAHALYFLVRGNVRIHRKLETGAQVDLAVLEQGAIFGEVALLAQTERTASASAQGPVVVVRVPREILQADYEGGRPYAQTLLLAVARRPGQLVQSWNIFFLKSSSSPPRLCSVIIARSRRFIASSRPARRRATARRSVCAYGLPPS